MKNTTTAPFLTLILLGLINTPLTADTTPIYKAVDADGTTVFTDQPIPEAVIVTPPPLNVVDQTPTTTRSHAQTSGTTTSDVMTVSSVSIVSPAPDQTFIDPQAPLWVEFALSPADTLPVGQSAQVLMDGRLLSTGSDNRLPIDIPERGTHDVQIRLIDATGSVQAESAVVQFHVRHHTAGKAH
ncbi:hypothetical protein ACUNV4_23510 [Granulosicoccus sp. 3-233]|uniref:hypothetical protein n=1 Tax=Granulosicoccus sp. 3-233 TaxID=3417969 RepID=UPI003D347822